LYDGLTRNYEVKPTNTPNGYSFTFEASSFVQTANIVAQIRAFDRAGNEAIETFAMRLDTVPPWVSLDPPDIIDAAGSPRKCTSEFDPLGDSPGDGQVVAEETRFRAFVWERGLVRPGATEIWISGVRDETVELFAQDDPTEPLLKDEDGDGVCDAINNAQSLGDKLPFVQALGAIAPGGTRPGPGVEIPGICIAEPALPPSAVRRCNGTSDLWYVPSHTYGGGNTIPVVYGFAPTGSGLGCTGTSFNMAGVSGWSCVAAAARDKAGARGNLGVSQPIKVCRWLKAGDCGGAMPGQKAVPPESLKCTDGCTLPDSWREWSQSTLIVR
jgi:hypothetical protein